MLRRDLYYVQVSGDVSGWQAMTQATTMCVQQRRHGACVSAPCACWAGGSALTGGEGAVQSSALYPGDGLHLAEGISFSICGLLAAMELLTARVALLFQHSLLQPYALPMR